MFKAWQYPSSGLRNEYATRTRRSFASPSSVWYALYSGSERLRSFSISSVLCELLPAFSSSSNWYVLGLAKRR